MTLNHRVRVEKYPFLNGVFGGLIPALKSSLYLTEGSQKPTHRKVASKPHPTPRGFLSKVGPTCSNSP